MYHQPPSPTVPPTPSSLTAPASTTTTTTTPLGGRRAVRNPALDTKLQQMALPLAPLVQLTSGQVHPAFPATLLSFWLLTEEQLEELAQFYHQRSPGPLTGYYPCPITWPRGLTLEQKRRKIGKFIGLRGCDTPVLEQQQPPADVFSLRAEEEIVEEARRARIRADEEEMARRKMTWF